MERAFALGTQAARHPLRRALPPPPVLRESAPANRWENTRLFLMTFVAGFIAFYGLIA